MARVERIGNVSFKEKEALDAGWSVDVIVASRSPSGEPVATLIGHIRRNKAGGYAYFEGAGNTVTVSMNSGDLASLKKKIASTKQG
jgi:hypothetical protein